MHVVSQTSFFNLFLKIRKELSPGWCSVRLEHRQCDHRRNNYFYEELSLCQLGIKALLNFSHMYFRFLSYFDFFTTVMQFSQPSCVTVIEIIDRQLFCKILNKQNM